MKFKHVQAVCLIPFIPTVCCEAHEESELKKYAVLNVLDKNKPERIAKFGAVDAMCQEIEGSKRAYCHNLPEIRLDDGVECTFKIQVGKTDDGKILFCAHHYESGAAGPQLVQSKLLPPRVYEEPDLKHYLIESAANAALGTVWGKYVKELALNELNKTTRYGKRKKYIFSLPKWKKQSKNKNNPERIANEGEVKAVCQEIVGRKRKRAYCHSPPEIRRDDGVACTFKIRVGKTGGGEPLFCAHHYESGARPQLVQFKVLPRSVYEKARVLKHYLIQSEANAALVTVWGKYVLALGQAGGPDHQDKLYRKIRDNDRVGIKPDTAVKVLEPEQAGNKPHFQGKPGAGVPEPIYDTLIPPAASQIHREPAAIQHPRVTSDGYNGWNVQKPTSETIYLGWGDDEESGAWGEVRALGEENDGVVEEENDIYDTSRSYTEENDIYDTRESYTEENDIYDTRESLTGPVSYDDDA